jgi:tRNA uridine 5-carbamoylmethylation protein Kti12
MSDQTMTPGNLFDCADLFLDAAKSCQINRLRIMREQGSNVDEVEVDKLIELERNLRETAKTIALQGITQINTDLKDPLKRIKKSVKDLKDFLDSIDKLRDAIKVVTKVVNPVLSLWQ